MVYKKVLKTFELKVRAGSSPAPGTDIYLYGMSLFTNEKQ